MRLNRRTLHFLWSGLRSDTQLCWKRIPLHKFANDGLKKEILSAGEHRLQNSEKRLINNI